MHPIALGALFALQCFHVLFLALHDWIPLGTFNDVKAVREANPGRKLVAATLISLMPFAIGLAASAVYFGRAYPAWLFWWLGISYGLLFVGELTAWCKHLSPVDKSACNSKPKSLRQAGRNPFNVGHNDLANDRPACS
jgi:hypothetical protein